MRKVANSRLWTIMLIMLISGSCNTIVMKAQDKVEVAPIAGAEADEGDHGKFYYRHPYF